MNLIATEEGYKSIVEEVESSIRELQSVNEQLQSVNTELYSTIEGVSRENADLLNLIETLDVGAVFLDRNLCIRRFTPQGFGLFDDMEGCIGRSISNLRPKLEYDELEIDARRVWRTQAPLSRQVADREGRWYLVRIQPYRTIEEKPDGVVCAFSDITRRKRVEEKIRKRQKALKQRLSEQSMELAQVRTALQNEKQNIQAYLDVAEVIFVGLDKKGRVILINRKGCEVLGHSEQEIIGKNWFRSFLPKQNQDRIRGIFDQLKGSRKALAETYEHPVLTGRGEERIILWHSVAIKNEGDKLIAIVGSGTDVTRQRQLEEQIMHISVDERQQIGRQIHDVISSHMTGMALLSRGLVAQWENEKRVDIKMLNELAIMADKGSAHAHALAKGLSPVILQDKSLAVAIRGLAQSIEIRSDLFCLVEADEKNSDIDGALANQLYWIAQEAAFNAERHAAASRLHIKLAMTEKGLELTVRDDGKGLTRDASQRGGMGLDIMRYRARLIGADLGIESMPGRGTQVKCCLPWDRIR